MYGQEEGLVPQLGDQRQLVLDQPADVLRRAVGEPAPQAGFRQGAQMCRRRQPRGNHLLRVFITQGVQRKAAARGDVDRGREHFRRVERGDRFPGPQMALAVLFKCKPAFTDRLAQTYGSQDIMQRPAPAAMHPDPACGDQG